MSDSIKVAIKVRPLIKREKDDNLTIQWVVQENSIVSTDPEMKKRGDGGFCFNHIFDTNASNWDIFDTIVRPIVDATVNGFNGTVFAYGQTSSGKTYTMMGSLEEPGIVPLAVEYMFDAIANTVGREFLLRVSYLEIYNEKVNDLLNKNGIDLKLKEDGSGQVILQCKEEITNCPENVLSLMKKGDKNRRIGETNMNERSSRSHTIFRITIESREAGADSDGAIQVSQLNLVDLAGSERVRQTGATGERFKEGRHINMSLSTLGLVIMQLSESQDNQKHVNFRDSKLTRLLQNSLGGNAMTAIICAVTPAALEETQCTLSFASRAKSVKNKPQINEVMSDAALLKRYAKQLAKLQAELQRIKNANRSAEVEEMESKLQEKDRMNQLLEERIELLKTRIVSGDTTNQESFKCKSKRRQTWGGPGMFTQRLSIFQSSADLPTIREMSFEKSQSKSIIKSVDIMNQTFQTAFTDFELELFESEKDRRVSTETVSDSDEEPFVTKRNKHRVTFKEDVFTIKSKNSTTLEETSFDITPEKCNISTQTLNYETSPSTPKNILRQHIAKLTNDYEELHEYTTLEKQLLCHENHCCTHEEGVENKIKYLPKVKERLDGLNFAEEQNVERIITELCYKLDEAEEQSQLKKDANKKIAKQLEELQKQVQNITSERNEFEYISSELRAQLREKTVELELKNMSQESVKEQEMEKVTELEKQIKNIISEKEDLGCINTELTKKLTDLQTQVENVTSERNEFEYMRHELYIELNKMSLELEKLKNDSKVGDIEMAENINELEKKSQDVILEKNELKRINIELNKKNLEFESVILSNQNVHRAATEQISKLQKEVENITMKKNQTEHINTELKQKISELDTKIALQEIEVQKANEKNSELEMQIESITSEKTELQRINAKLNQRVFELESKIILEQTTNQDALAKICELEKQIENIASEKNKSEQSCIELIQKISESESKIILEQTTNQDALAKIYELEKQIENIASEKDKSEQSCIELTQKIPELESKIMNEETRNQKAVEKISELNREIENITLEKNEIENINHQLRDELNKKILDLEQINNRDYINEYNSKNVEKNLQHIINIQTENQDIKNEVENQLVQSCPKCNESNADISSLIISMEVENSQLEETLHLKSQELKDAKDIVQDLKMDIEKLQTTMCILTNENMEMAAKLGAQQEYAKQTELSLQKTVDELYMRITEVTEEKIHLENDLAASKNQLESVNSKAIETYSEEQHFTMLQNKIEKLTAENIELSASIIDRNREIENIKESKSLFYDHECIYKENVTVLAQKNECLLLENNELSTDLIDKIEENDSLKEQCDMLKSKIDQLLVIENNSDDLEHLKSENNTLKTEILELKTKMKMLSDDNAKLSNNLLETIENLDHSHNEKSYNSTLHLSTIFSDTTEKTNETGSFVQKEYGEVLVDEATLQNKIDHLTRLNKKLSDLKLTSCNQCAHVRKLNESHRTLKLEAKALNKKLEDLQRKFDQKCADTEILKSKMNQELNLSAQSGVLNVSFVDEMNVTLVEEKIQNLNDELETLKANHDKLSVLYEDKCNEHEQLQHNLTVDIKNVNKDSMLKESKNKNRIEQIQNDIVRLKDEIDELKKNNANPIAILDQFKNEKANLLNEIGKLNVINEDLQERMSNNESIAMEKARIFENELANMSKEIEQFSIREKEFENQKLMLELKLEELKAKEQNECSLINQLHERISSLTNKLTTSSSMELKYKEELTILKKQYEDLETEKGQDEEIEQYATIKIKELEEQIKTLQQNIIKQECLCKEFQEKDFKLEKLLQESEQDKYILIQKVQDSDIKFNSEFDSMILQYENRIKESEINFQKINETLNKYIDENLNLIQERDRLQNIEKKFNDIINENEEVYKKEKALISDNEKLSQELYDIRKSLIKELKSLTCDINFAELLDVSINDIFVILLQTLVSKENEIIKTVRETFEKDKQKLEDEKQQSADTEKRVTIWAKELETEIEKLQTELTERESEQKEYRNKVSQLEHLLLENNHEKEILKEKITMLETDFDNLQIEFDKQYKADSEQEEAIFVAQKREREAQETFKTKEIELESKINSEKVLYENKISDLIHSVESYKTKILELNSTIEGLEVNEKQLKNIIEANSTEMKKKDQHIEKLNIELEQLTEIYNEVSQKIEQKTSHVEEITAILKRKCDMLSEYKTKYETIIPEYEMLKEHIKDQKAAIERYKEEVETLKKEREKELEIIKDKWNSEEIKNAGLTKQLNELKNKNIALTDELNELQEKYEELQQTNAKLERKIRNSTSKIKAETEIEEMRELNRRLQNNLEGASNCVAELQDIKNQTLKELDDLKSKYELVLQENSEVKNTLLLYKSEYSTHNSSLDKDKYNALLFEKNKIALELEDKKLRLNQKDKDLRQYISQIQQLTEKNKELDDELEEYAKKIQEQDIEISKLEDKLHSRLTENALINELEEKLKDLNEKNEKLQDQVDAFRIRLSMEQTEYTVHPIQNKSVNDLQEKLKFFEQENRKLKNEIIELQTRLKQKRISLEESISNQSNTVIFDKEFRKYEEVCQQLKKKIHELELQLVSKNGKIATLEIQIQSENFPYQKKCKELKEILLAFRNKNAELSSEVKKLQKTVNDVNAWECDICRRWRVNRKDQSCQTIPDNTIRFCSINSGIVEDHVKIQKLEKEKALMKDLCRSRSHRIKELENRIKELEVQSSVVSRSIEIPGVRYIH